MNLPPIESTTSAVRAFTLPAGFNYKRNIPQKRTIIPNRILVFDTETRTDLYQNMTFGYFEIYENGILEMTGILYDPDVVTEKEEKILQEYSEKENTELYSLMEFRVVFRHEAYDRESLVVGFNLPFDISRIAIRATRGRAHHKKKGDDADPDFLPLKRNDVFSFVISKNLDYPRLEIENITNTMSFMGWGNPRHSNRKFKGNFLDLRTLSHALTDAKHTLESACEAFKTDYKKYEAEEHGKITPEYIKYCINDVKSTYSLYLNAKKEFESYGLSDMQITKAYTPASIGKHFLKSMNIRSFLSRKRMTVFQTRLIGKIMSCYYGGRTECKIRKKPTKIDYLDFLSMYPYSMYASGLVEVCNCKQDCTHSDATEEIKKLVDGFNIEKMRDKNTWKKLQAIVLVEPDGDVLPIKAHFQGKVCLEHWTVSHIF